MTCVEVGRNSMMLGQWSDHMRRIDCYENDLDATAMLANFSATLNLRTRQTDN